MSPGASLVIGLGLLGAVLGAAARAQAAGLSLDRDPRIVAGSGTTVVDTRPTQQCARQTLAGGHCLAPEDLLGPRHRLPAFRQLVWVLGTAGLSGKGTVVVAGESAQRRDFVAGVLFLLGQHRVVVLARPLSELLDSGQWPRGPGRQRAMAARPLFQGAARARLLVFRSELARALHASRSPTLLDGRARAAYWGIEVRGARGGHIPGARSLPAAVARGHAEGPRLDPGDEPVAYAQDPLSSIAYFTMLRADLGVNARVYPRGWRDWAAHPALPVETRVFPGLARVAPAATREDHPSDLAIVAMLAISGMLMAAAALFMLTRRNRWI